MYIDTLIKIFARNFDKFKQDITLYHNKSNLWLLNKSISYYTGNLCLHRIGILNHFKGGVIGDAHYIRDRELKFSHKNVPRVNLLVDIDTTIVVVENTSRSLHFRDLDTIYPN
jgi:hypothetical protein